MLAFGLTDIAKYDQTKWLNYFQDKRRELQVIFS